MNWFKKSIAYDQKRKLIFLPLLIILPIILSVMGKIQSVTDDSVRYNSQSYALGIGDSSYLMVLAVTALIAMISIGIRDKSEVNYMESMPMKNHSVIMTKISCAYIAVILPLVVGFLVTTFFYITNKSYFDIGGYLYLDIVYRYVIIILIAVIIVNGIYLGSSLYKNIKVAIVISVAGILSLGYFLASLSQCFENGNFIIDKIGYSLNSMIRMIQFPLTDILAYYPYTIGNILILLGIGVLLFVLVDYISAKFSNDVYDNLFSFKISKVIYYVVAVLTLMTVLGMALGFIIDYTYLNPLRRTVQTIGSDTYLLVGRIKFIAMVVLTPLWILISRKISEKLEERF